MAKKPTTKKIREAVCANHGGLETAGDAGIMRVWNSLDQQTQKQYLGAAKKQPETETGNAAGDRTGKNVSDSP